MAKKPKNFRTDKKSDSARKAKPSGYRYNIHDKNHPKYYSRPTASEIKKHLAGQGKWKDMIYYEARVERGDSNQTKKLKKGGSLDKDYIVSVNIDERGEYSASVVDKDDNSVFEINTELMHELQEDGFLKYKAHEDISRLEKHLKSQGVISKDSNIVDEFNDEEELKKGGSIKNQYKDRDAHDIWNSWSLEQRQHFMNDHADVIRNKSIADIKEGIDTNEYLDKEARFLPHSIHSTLIEHKMEGQYDKGGEMQTETVNKSSIKSKKHPFTFTFDKAYRKGDVVVQRVGGSDMWEVGIDGEPMGRVKAQVAEIAIKKAKEVKKEYEKGGEINGKYLDTISADKKAKILKNIANHYGISEADAEEEVKDADAEMLYEYIADDQLLRMSVYNDLEKKMKNGGDINEIKVGDSVRFTKEWNEDEGNKMWNRTDTGIRKVRQEDDVQKDENGEPKLTLDNGVTVSRKYLEKTNIDEIKNVGKFNKFNPKDFSLAELQSIFSSKDIFLTMLRKGNNLSEAKNRDVLWKSSDSSTKWNKIKDIRYTISEHGELELSKGSENLYLEVVIYPVDGYESHQLQIYSKENIKGLKEFSNIIVDKLKKGGSIKRSKAGIRQDKKIKAKKGGKRTSADGNVYYEHRANRSDADLRKKFKEGGEFIDSRVDDVLNHYLMASLWSTTNVDNEDEEFLDANHSIEDFDPQTRNELREMVKKFLVDNADALEKSELSDDQIGHDLWLTQNHHGAGFFDRGLPKDIEEQLEKSAQSFKSVDLYVGDDKKIHKMKSGGDVNGKTKTIHGISHSILREPIDKIGMLEIEFSHPLGTVYSDGKYGYVQSGDDWLRFSIVDLDDIKKKMADGGDLDNDITLEKGGVIYFTSSGEPVITDKAKGVSKENIIKEVLQKCDGKVSKKMLKEIIGRDLGYTEVVGVIKLRKPHMCSYFVQVK